MNAEEVSNMGEQIETEFEFERPTKRTYRFRETVKPPKIGVLYVQKSALPGQPKRLRVTVEVLE